MMTSNDCLNKAYAVLIRNQGYFIEALNQAIAEIDEAIECKTTVVPDLLVQRRNELIADVERIEEIALGE